MSRKLIIMISLCKKIIAGGLSDNIALKRKRFLLDKSAALFSCSAGFFIISAVLGLNVFWGFFTFNSLPFAFAFDCYIWPAVSCLFLMVSIILFVKAVKFFKLFRNAGEEVIIDEAIAVSPPARSHAIAGIIVAGLGICVSWHLLIAPLQYAVAAVFVLSGLCLALSGLFAHVALYGENIVICTQKEMLAIPCAEVKWLYTECCDGCTETLCIGLAHRIIRTEIPGNDAGQTFYEKCIKACENAAIGYKPSMLLAWEHEDDWGDIVSATRSDLE